MICEYCNTDTVIWKGPFSNLTHTECTSCGRTNCQQVYHEEEDMEEPMDLEDRLDALLGLKTK